MEGHSPHSGSHYYTAAPLSPSSATAIAAAAFFNKVCANHAVPPYAPRAEHYSEMFRSFRSGLACSIPMLDLPPNDESIAAFDSVGCSGFVYSEIFGGFDFADFAVSYDELFRQSNGSQQSSDSDDAWTEVGTGSLQEESDASACSGRNQYFLNGGVHQTTDSKFNVSYHKANKGTTEDSNPIHVAELGDVPGNSYIYDYDGSNLQKEDEERYSSGVADDIILHVDSSGSISVETQSESASNPSIPSHGSDRKAGRSHGTNLRSIGISFSDVCPTAEPSYSPPSSRQPPTVVETKKDPVSSMSNFERPKGNASKALFDIGSLDFLNVELDTGSSAIASAAAIQEAMDRAKLKLKSARESMERKMDDANGTRSVMKNDMNVDGKMRMVFEESISRKDELQGEHGSGYNLFKNSGKGMQDFEASQVLPDPLQAEITLNGAAKAPQRKITKSQNSSEYPNVDEESRKRETVVYEKDGKEKQLNEAEKRIVSAHDLATKSLKLERSKTNRIEDEVEVTEEEMENPTKASKSENLQKMDKGDLHAELKSTEEDSYEGRHLNAESEYSMSSIVPSTLDETNNKVPEMTCECEDPKSSSLAARPDKKNIDAMIKNAAAEVGKGVKAIKGNPVPEDIEEDVRLKRKEEFERERLRELELERERERDRELEKERHKKLEEERDKKKEKLHIKRLAELKEREGEKKLGKDHLRKLEEERQRESEKGMEKEHLRAGQAAVEREIVEARQKAMAEARERLEKACANFREKSFSEKSSTEARLRAERAAVARANAEARERAIEKAMAERTTFEAQKHVERSDSEKLSSPFSDIQLRHTSSSSDLWNTDKSDEVEGQSIQRSRSRLERHCRTVERVAKAIAEKNTRDLNAQKEQAERNRLAESLDADIKQWSSGKEGNLRALLSTLQYILGQDIGWHPIPLTEVITSSAVKKAYRKATLCVHPDKLQQRGATIQQKYICEKVFDLLKDAWNKFSSEER